MAQPSRFSDSLARSVALLNGYAAVIGFAGILVLATFGQGNWFVELRDQWNAETLWRQEHAVSPWLAPVGTVVVHVPSEIAVLGVVEQPDRASLGEVSGWVGAVENGSQIKSVLVTINGKPVAESRRLRKFAFSDILFDKADFIPLGWSVEFSVQSVPKGASRFAAAAVLDDGGTHTFATWTLDRPTSK